MHNYSVIIQARMGSTRLPGKILKPLSGKPMLLHVYERLQKSAYINQTIIATTDLSEDDTVENFCALNNIKCFRGSSDDVLSRYYHTAHKYNCEVIIRITADCPLIDPFIIDKMILEFENNIDKVDYLSNTLIRSFPRGLDTEIFKLNALARAFNNATSTFDREHVTPYIYNNHEIFRLINFANEIDLSAHRWTVDTIEDFNLVEIIYNKLFETTSIFLLDDILELFRQDPSLFDINKSVMQKNN
ncbi:MAG: glycosyltransferase family protein [Melioribacteraceae bacterium]|nr:glycosyltransferase family protein [Melioribacteraceae bacterium]